MATTPCTQPVPQPSTEALSWVARALRSERVLRALERDERGLIRED